MYCYTYATELTCIFNELRLWSHISSDHPIFLKTVASLSKVDLPKEAVDNLDHIQKNFIELYKNVLTLKKSVDRTPKLNSKDIVSVKKAITDFILYDSKAISFYPQLLDIGKENMVWQELVKHIINEQAFMLDLFKDLKQQI
ncbi:MAG: hypothetical protein CVV02_03275 [Firmicutes bacterium HGW-Firmicutes-7]|nr:MAG: hypothetical protein CVV02_03275 [Firmicutes bacterium HGW-Firmicutes-7]